MGNFGHSTIVVEGANAKKVYDFLLEIAKNTPYKYDIKPLRIGDKECESYLVCREVEEGEEVENGVWIYLFSLNDGRFESMGASYEICLKYQDDRLIIRCSYWCVNAIRLLLLNLPLNEADGKWYLAQWSESDTWYGNMMIDDEGKYFFSHEVQIEDSEEGELIESVDYVDKEFHNLVKEIGNDDTLLL